MNVSVLFQLRIRISHDIARNRKAESFASTGLRNDKCVHADDSAIDIDERSSAVSWIDGSVGLNEDLRIVGTDLAANRADNAHAHRIVQTHRAAESEYQLALFQFVG